MQLDKTLCELQKLKMQLQKHYLHVNYEIRWEWLCLEVNNYAIYNDGIVYNMCGCNIPMSIFKIRDKFIQVLEGLEK